MYLSSHVCAKILGLLAAVYHLSPCVAELGIIEIIQQRLVEVGRELWKCHSLPQAELSIASC